MYYAWDKGNNLYLVLYKFYFFMAGISEKTLAVIIPCYNNAQWTYKTLMSLEKNTINDYLVILVDDCSTDDTIQLAKDFSKKDNFFYLRNSTNKGVNPSWNIGVQAALDMDIPFICIANNDLEFSYGWDYKLVLKLNLGYSVVSPYTTEGVELPKDFPQGQDRHTNPFGDLGIVGCCFMFRDDFIRKMGKFPEKPRIYFGDNYIVDYCKHNGLKYGEIKESYVHHYLCQTTKTLNNNEIFPREKLEYDEVLRQLKQTKKFTIGYRARFPDTFNKYLKPSLRKLTNADVLWVNATSITQENCSDMVSDTYPADNYNKMIDACRTPYLILTHEDISFTPDVLECIENTIAEYPDFGALGLVGVNTNGEYKWSDSNGIYEVDTVDSCFLVIRLDLGVRFNSEEFGGFHLYVEDYCGQLQNMGRKVYTIKLNENSKIEHHAKTWHTLGAAWGDYQKYEAVWLKKYPNLKKT